MNGLTSNGLLAVSTDLLVSTINAHGTHLRLIVLNGCKTFGAAQSILLQCPTVEYCICWTTLVESKAASIFAKAFADMLAVHSYFTGNDSLATVFKAFHGAKAAVLEETQLAHARGIGPIGMHVYAFIDPQDDFTTYQECPCNNRCQNCSCAKTEDRTPRKNRNDERYMHNSLVCGVYMSAYAYRRLIGRQKYPNPDPRMLPPIAAGIPVLLSKFAMMF